MRSTSRLCVLTGCQMEGLVSALRILFPHCEVEGFHTYRLLGDDRAAIRERLLTADLVFTLPMEAQFGEFSFERIERLGPRIQFVPAVVFAAFHPDITYLERLDDSRVQTPMTDYNSAIAVAAICPVSMSRERFASTTPTRIRRWAISISWRAAREACSPISRPAAST